MKIITAICKLCKIGLNVLVLKIRYKYSKRYRNYCDNLWKASEEAIRGASRKQVYVNERHLKIVLKEIQNGKQK